MTQLRRFAHHGCHFNYNLEQNEGCVFPTAVQQDWNASSGEIRSFLETRIVLESSDTNDPICASNSRLWAQGLDVMAGLKVSVTGRVMWVVGVCW